MLKFFEGSIEVIDSKQLVALFSLAKSANSCDSLESLVVVNKSTALNAEAKVKIEFKESGRENSLIQEKLHRSYGL